MTRLVCPFCGPRELAEFEFHKTLPNAGSSAFSMVYERIDSLTRSEEYWQHVKGCRAWLHVLRNPSNGDVLEVDLLARTRP